MGVVELVLNMRYNFGEVITVELMINKEFVLNTAKELLLFNSPSGYCNGIMKMIKVMLTDLDLTSS